LTRFVLPCAGALFVLLLLLGALPLDLEGGEAGTLLLVALLVLVPIGLRLILDTEPEGLTRRLIHVSLWAWIPGAVAAVAALALPVGVPAAACAAVWMAALTPAMAAGALRFLKRWPRVPIEELCVDLSLLYFAPGAAHFLIHRAGIQVPMYSDTITFLTAVHFHAIPPGAILTTACAGRYLRSHLGLPMLPRVYVVGGALVALSPPVIAAGFTTLPAFQIVGAAGLALGLLTTAAHVLRFVVPTHPVYAARLLLVIASLSIVPGMILAVAWSWSYVLGGGSIGLPLMVRFHGWTNAIGFSLCGELARR
jgi:hypothetical protein